MQGLKAGGTGLARGRAAVLALGRGRGGGGGGGGPLEPLAAFTTNPAGAAVVDAIGPIRQLVRASTPAERRYLVIAAGTPAQPGPGGQAAGGVRPGAGPPRPPDRTTGMTNHGSTHTLATR